MYKLTHDLALECLACINSLYAGLTAEGAYMAVDKRFWLTNDTYPCPGEEILLRVQR